MDLKVLYSRSRVSTWVLILATTGIHTGSPSSLEEEKSLLSEVPLTLLQWLCLKEGLWSSFGEPRAEPERVERVEARMLEDEVNGPRASGLWRIPQTCLYISQSGFSRCFVGCKRTSGHMWYGTA
jgi:hypothetical protein